MTPRRSYRADERGAVTLMGLAMALFLIGATWFVFGLARALVFRERVQEAADAAAFSSAAIHAKGMNLIAAINLVLFAITAVWMLLRTFEHAMYILQTTAVWNGSNCHGIACRAKACEVGPLSAALTASGLGGPTAACRVAEGLQSTRDVNKKARKAVGDRIDEWFPALSKAQDVTARVAPAAGVAASLALGSLYEHFTIAVSPSLLPGEDLLRLGKKVTAAAKKPGGPKKPDPKASAPSKRPAVLGPPSPPTDGDEEEAREEQYEKDYPTAEARAEAEAAKQRATGGKAPIGLPVVSNKFGTLCGRAVKIPLDRLKNAFGAIPGVGAVISLPIVSTAVGSVFSLSSSYLEEEFCSDHDWAGNHKKTKTFAKYGPKTVFEHAENGNDLMQVYAFTHGVFTDRGDVKKVALAKKTFGEPPARIAHWYVAQAEFYFDCGAKWDAPTCNGNDNAMFSMRWRARLRRVHPPAVGEELLRYVREALFSGPVKKAIQEGLGFGGYQPKPGDEPADLLDRYEKQVYDDVFGKGFDWLKGKVDDELDIGNGKTGELPSEVLH